MGDKSVETLCNKIEFLSILVTFPPFPPKQCWFFYFFNCTDHSTYTTLNWGAGGIRELTLEANKIEQLLKYRKASFPKSVSTTFVAHCSIITVFIDSRLWKTKHPQKRFQNFRQSCSHYCDLLTFSMLYHRAVIGGFRSNLSITHQTDRNFGNVSAGVLFSKVAYQRKPW